MNAEPDPRTLTPNGPNAGTPALAFRIVLSDGPGTSAEASAARRRAHPGPVQVTHRVRVLVPGKHFPNLTAAEQADFYFGTAVEHKERHSQKGVPWRESYAGGTGGPVEGSHGGCIERQCSLVADAYGIHACLSAHRPLAPTEGVVSAHLSWTLTDPSCDCQNWRFDSSNIRCKTLVECLYVVGCLWNALLKICFRLFDLICNNHFWGHIQVHCQFPPHPALLFPMQPKACTSSASALSTQSEGLHCYSQCGQQPVL